jgi:hypothetical protein
MVEDVRFGGKHQVDGRITVVEIRRKDLDHRARAAGSEGNHSSAEMIRATIRQVVARNGSDHSVLEAHAACRLGNPFRFV